MDERLLKLLMACCVILALGSLAYMLIFPYTPLEPSTTTQSTVVKIGKRLTAGVIYIYPDRFEPSELTIKAGEIVEWINKDTKPRTIAFSNPPLTFTRDPGASFQMDFSAPGTYEFWDQENESIRGKIVVS